MVRVDHLDFALGVVVAGGSVVCSSDDWSAGAEK